MKFLDDDENSLAVATNAEQVWVYDLSSMSCSYVLAGHTEIVICLDAGRCSNGSTLIVTGSKDNADRTACIWKLPELVLVSTLKGHKKGIWSVDFSPDDLCVITASGDRTVKLWSIADGSCLKTFEGHNSGVLRVSFISHGNQFVSCGADGLVKLWTVQTDECNSFMIQGVGIGNWKDRLKSSLQEEVMLVSIYGMIILLQIKRRRAF